MRRAGVAVLLVVAIVLLYTALWTVPWVITGFVNFPFYGQNPQHTGFLDVGDMPVVPYSKWNFTGGGPIYDLSYYDGILYFCEYDKNVTALYANNGSVMWSKAIGGGMGAPAIWNRTVYAPTYKAGTDRLYALNATDGSTLWYHSMPANDHQGSPVIEDGIVVTATYANGDGIYAYWAVNGTPIWNYSITGGVSQGSGHPAIWNGIVYATSTKDPFGVGSYRVHAINLTTGVFIWNYTATGLATPVTVAYGRAYFGDEVAQKLFALNASTGAYLWNTSLGAATRNNPSVYDGVVYIGDDGDGSGVVRLHAIDAYNGTELWNLSLPDAWENIRYTKPLVTNESLAFFAGNDIAYGVNLTSRSVMWRYAPNTGDFWSFTAARFERGMLYMPTYNWVLYALQAAPDLRVTAISYEPSTVFVGDTVNITATINNNGNPTLGSFDVSFYINDSLQGTNTVGQMGQNGTVNTSFSWQASYGPSEIKIFADSAAQQEEYNETNNNATALISVSRKALPISPANGTIVDRSGVNDTYDDYIVLQANLTDGSTGTTVTFYANRTAPSQYASSLINLGSNNTVNGVAILNYTPNPSTDYAGTYEWWATASNAVSEGSRTFDIYGGLNVTFRYNDTFPNTTYESGDNVTVEVLLSSLSPENETDLFNFYNAEINVTLTPPTGAPITFSANNTSSTIITTLGSGTANDSCEIGGAGNLVDFANDLVPNPVPVGPWCGGPALTGYNLTWTCDAATCPGESGNSYTISDSDDSGMAGCGGSWNGYDFFEVQGFDVTDLCPDTVAVAGWTFDVIASTTKYFWSGSTILETEAGSWDTSASASADWFFSGSTSRGFTVPGVAAPPSVPTAGAGPGKAVAISAESELIVVEDEVEKITLDRGTSEPITILVKNIGDFVVTDIIIEAVGLPPGWVVVTPSKIDSLGQNEVAEVKAYLFIPETAALGKYELTFEAHSYYVKALYAVEITVTDECEPCPKPAKWSECIEGKQSRTNYRCGPHTDYKCVEWTQERECIIIPEEVVDNTPLLAVLAGIGAVVIWWFYWKK